MFPHYDICELQLARHSVLCPSAAYDTALWNAKLTGGQFSLLHETRQMENEKQITTTNPKFREGNAK